MGEQEVHDRRQEFRRAGPGSHFADRDSTFPDKAIEDALGFSEEPQDLEGQNLS
jgi:hypothetical protein